MKKEGIKKLYSKYRFYIFPLLTFLPIVLMVVMVIYPQISKYIANKEAEHMTENKIQLLEDKTRILEDLDDDDLARKVELSLLALPSDPALSSMIGVIQRLTGQAGITVISIQFGQSPSVSNQASGFTLKMEVIGPKPSISQLLDSIEGYPRVMKIGTIELATQSQDIVNATLTIDVFYSEMPTQLGAIDAPLPELSSQEEAILLSLEKESGGSTTLEKPILVPKGKADPFN